MTAKISDLNLEIRSLLKQFKLSDMYEKYDTEVQTAIDNNIGLKACERGKSVLFVNAIELVDDLYNAIQAGTLKQKFVKLSKIDLIIIDDIGYLKMDKEKESIFFSINPAKI
ncbi:DNA replication protein DnaC [Clostridium punense]|uniref:DNA replication protein DnaC n=1 Tax=Clostridium punense TaxID=1054297 RepID=A0ABS4K9A7_9CLOT|nr:MULTISPECIES: ATP-binding protein [Clostridium]EQB85815.1 hypothetical protein M918_17420 [Clostridium sp. BL8]MBP2024359.1 DNA replication protein DnaC [Clostridium punense]